MQDLSGVPLDGPVPLVLGDIVFEAFEIPAKLAFGTKQKLVVQHFPGGGREVQAMGGDPTPLSWSGRFRGPGAAEDAASVNRMAGEGAVVPLSWSIFLYDVVIRSFSASFEAPWEVPYKISCEVVRDRSTEEAAEEAGADTLFLEDVDDLSDAAAALSGSGLGLALGQVVAATDAVVDSGVLALAGDALAVVGIATPPGTRATIATTLAAIDGSAALAQGSVSAAATLATAGALAAGADPAAAAAALTATARTLALAAQAQQAAWRLARLGHTLAAF